MARRRTALEQDAVDGIAEAVAVAKKTISSDDLEDIIPNYSEPYIILDIKADGEWQRRKYEPAFVDGRLSMVEVTL